MKRDNHYVAQSYLKHWADSENKVWRYKVIVPHQKVKQWKRSSLKGIVLMRKLKGIRANELLPVITYETIGNFSYFDLRCGFYLLPTLKIWISRLHKVATLLQFLLGCSKKFLLTLHVYSPYDKPHTVSIHKTNINEF